MDTSKQTVPFIRGIQPFSVRVLPEVIFLQLRTSTVVDV
jgi:hypothetical protein